eukprot:54987_1
MSVHTISTILTANKIIYSVPKRFQFPIPHISDFDDQILGNPGWRLSDIFGAFDVSTDPLNSTNYVLKQSVPQNPDKNAYLYKYHHWFQPNPFTAFPSGTNWMNYNISCNVFSTLSNIASVCGLIPLWSPVHWNNSYSMGICLYLEYGKNRNWYLSMNSYNKTTLIIKYNINNDKNKIGVINNWNYLSLGFDDGTFQILIGETKKK